MTDPRYPIAYPDTPAAMLERLRRQLRDVVPDVELRVKAEIACEVNRLKREKRAIILGHNYMEPALFHSVPDFTGDSLQLSRIAARAEADRIVFCGVRFMAETAKILNPGRQVLLPTLKGGCSLAAAVTGEDVRAVKALLPGIPVVTYVNTYAEVKAESDYACTSGNAAAVVRRVFAEGHDRILFLPDEYLGRNTARETGAAFVLPVRGADGVLRAPALPPRPQKTIIGWAGRCEVHERFTLQDIRNARSQFPDVVVLSHPECSPEVVAASDYSGGTTDMVRYAQNLKGGRVLLLTECAMGDNIMASCPRVEMLRICSIRCPHMNEITLDETLESLRQERYVIDVPAAIRERARLSLDRMIATG
jgi:quinolinate synthase